MSPEYVAVKSALYEFKFLICVVLLLLGIFPGVIDIVEHVVSAHHCTVTFYNDRYVIKSGVFNTRENEIVFKGIISVSCNITFGGKIFGYGTVKADMVGKHDLFFSGVKNPEGLRDYLLTRKIDADGINHLVID